MVPRDRTERSLLVGAVGLKEIRFWKTETIGNDFVLVHSQDAPDADWAELAIKLCARRFNIGADGLLVVEPSPGGLRLRMFNPDGSEDFCGNGLRCAGWHGVQQGWVSGDFVIEHGGKDIQTRVSESGVSVMLPPASFEPDNVPIHGPVERTIAGMTGTAVSTGSTHFVVLCESLPDDHEFFAVSPLIEHDPAFPERTSVMYTQVLAQNHLRLRIWERGVGETLGCGTGSVAAAVVWARQSGASGMITVSNPGGDLHVSLASYDSPVTSVSQPVVSFTGRIALPNAALEKQKASLV